MAQINKPSDYFNTVLYTGNGSTQSITGVGFQPDWTWIKARNDAQEHNLYDSVRGATKGLQSDGTGAEYTLATSLTSFDSDGFSIGSFGGINGSSDTEVAWNWLAGGTASSNTDGTITSTVSASTTSGFSICTFTTSGGSSDTIGHGLGSVPSLIIVRPYTSVSSWFVYHQSLGNGNYMRLNNTDAVASSSIWNNTTPTSSVFSLGLGAYGNSATSIAYCFAEKKGFSKFGSYTGNGSTDGTFIYTGMRPAFVIIKRTNSATPWCMWDNKRNTFNVTQNYLYTNSSDAEGSGAGIDIDMLSNGFKLKTTSGFLNTSGDSFIYMCFAENPLVTTGKIPATAR